MEEFFKLASNYAFPIALSVYLLTRFEKKLEDLGKAIKGRDGVLDRLDDIEAIIKSLCKKKGGEK